MTSPHLAVHNFPVLRAASRLPILAAVTAAVVMHAGAQARPADIDEAFRKFWSARDPAAASRAAAEILRARPGFPELYRRLKAGRPYDGSAPTGVLSRTRVGGGGREFPYTLDVPATYDPAKRYQVRIQLHGGVMREVQHRWRNGVGRLAGAEQIYVLPEGWNEAPWWADSQVENLRAILDTVKRTYNVDENRVVVSGVSDGGTGAYYIAMRDQTPYAAFLPLNGSLLVLTTPNLDIGGDLFPTNLRNSPFFVVNGGRDPLYPIASVEPFLNHLYRGGVRIEYRPQPNAGHDTGWWPALKEDFERFVSDHPRLPLPDTLTWETSDPRTSGRFRWLVIDRLGSTAGEAAALTDLNEFVPPPTVDFGMRMNGIRVERVLRGSNADTVGLEADDVVQRVGDTTIRDGQDLLTALQHLAIGGPVRFEVMRHGRHVALSGTFTPEQRGPSSTRIFERRSRSGRVDLVRRGNVVDAATRGVAEFTLLVSPDQFDIGQPITVLTNGHVAFVGRVEPDAATLVQWAARDNDRTMLFGAEVKVRVR